MIKVVNEGIILKIIVQPNAKKDEITGVWTDSLKLRVSAVPESGKANKACIELLALKLNVPKRSIQIIKGHVSRKKQMIISGIKKQEVMERLGLALDK